MDSNILDEITDAVNEWLKGKSSASAWPTMLVIPASRIWDFVSALIACSTNFKWAPGETSESGVTYKGMHVVLAVTGGDAVQVI